MTLSQKIVTARKQQGITQEELAASTNLTVRTIQRIESGETTPRSFTLKAIATSLGISFEELTTPATTTPVADKLDIPVSEVPVPQEVEDNQDFLQTLCLSCFSYLVLPFIHFLIPMYLVRKRKGLHPVVKAFAKGVVRTQIYWIITLHLLLFLTLIYNLICASYGHRSFVIHYLIPFFGMYLLNAAVIIWSFIQSKKVTDIAPAAA